MPWSSRNAPSQSAEAQARDRDWEAALQQGRLPDPVLERLADARAGRTPWVATMTPAELLTIRSHGCRPIATVAGTCWYNFGWSWTEGHAEGWAYALDRIRQEAYAAGANAVVDVQMRTIRHQIGSSMDFTLLGTAIRVEALPPSTDPVIATVPALEFVQLLEMGIVPTGIAVGARYEWLGYRGFGRSSGDWRTGGGGWNSGWNSAARRAQWQANSWVNQPMMELTDFWEQIRRDAHADLRREAAEQGNGVLAHTQFGQLIRREQDKAPPALLGRHIVIGTVVDTRKAPFAPGIEPVIDMRDSLSPLRIPNAPRHAAYHSDVEDEEGGI